MKSGKCLLMLLMILFSPMAFAQQSGVNVTGSVVEQGSDTPIEQATVRLLNVKDSAMVRGVVSARNGSFTLKNVKKGSYLLHITFIGYDPLYQPLQITGKKNPVNVGKLELSDGAIELGEAVVIGKAPEVTVRNDTVEYNADSYKVTEGSVLEDLLKKMPGVEVDSEGKITVNGKEVKKVMVDGKEFFSDDPKVASKNLPAKMIDKLQVLDKKSDMAQMTGFDDGEEETVINLTVKPGMKQGWFGNAYGGYGSKDRYEGNAMVNRFVNNDQITFMGGANNTNNMGFSDLASTMFSGMGGGGGRRGGFGAGSGITSSGNAGLNFSKEFKPDKLTLGGNTRYSHSDNDARSKSDRQNILPGDSSSYDNSEAMSRTKSDNFGVDFRLEWKPDTMTQLIFRPSFSFSHSMNDNFSDATTLDNERDTVNTNKSSNYSESNGYNLNASIDFSRKLNNKGRVFSATLSGGNSDSYSDGMNRSDIVYFNQTDALKNSIIDQRSRYDNKGFNYRAYVSWVEPIGHNNFIQATYSISQRKQEALKNVYNQDADGIYNVLDSAYSQSYRNNFISQRASLSFKSQREKFNYTIGLNLDPSYSSSENFVGDTTLSKITRKVVNLSPMAQFNYMFDKRTNLRIMYNGRTSQPSMTQLQPVADISDPTNITIGNPDLNPRYTNNVFIRFQQFTPEKQRAFMIMANGSYIINDIVSYTSYNQETGVKTTTYKNVNGNYSGNVRMMLNTPLKNKKFSINSMTMASFANSNGYINEEKNTNRNLILSERGGIDFRSSYLDLGVNGNIRYNATSNSLQKENNQNTFNYGAGGYTTIYLPLNFKIESDVNWSTNSGYGDGFKQNEVLWNASASKSFLKNNQGTLRFKIYDILQQRSNISRSVTASYIQDSEYNTLGSYFMVHFIYRFSIFKGGASASDVKTPGRSGRGRGPMGPPPGHRF
ncbi:TonB-dependent receptor [Parabacteroides distasonis]|uniref:Outer membrane beta-barrel protein n=1 Tax=Parabacteroides distasonis TaxID=823 RepID=A0A6I2MUX5_PARDI|nr:TonB-dependent receptor [Parabacteroides distasonis]MRY06698.1 outer membrane beta-barrel protein [Parabacteroides distasonis]MRY57377.1 outer membrane beta-barrel protein [Parabacteroides distasonis]MRY66729.1 outer membrane beta-barrel protein [Parabacteroides distasonis]MRZ62924.1 outer membrane beta-barrel protein [Parabacteroides distasonis]MSA30484.1 outer membrane beta-barrel protein [Parabacteroides distasonis]